MHKKIKLCTFFGTFNPIHNAHIELAKFVEENYDFDKILFVPAYWPPHKKINPKMAQHRLNMVELALEDYPQFDVTDLEYQLGEVSYTFYSIQKLYEMYDVDGKIIVVDDNNLAIQNLEKKLQTLGISNIETALSGKIALEKINNGEINSELAGILIGIKDNEYHRIYKFSLFWFLASNNSEFINLFEQIFQTEVDLEKENLLQRVVYI